VELCLAPSLPRHYHSASQIARVLTEKWIADNMFCPRCGGLRIEHFKNNQPVADFYCPYCKNEYELKSRNGTINNKIIDGSYDTMIRRITSNTNPDFLFLSYSKKELCVTDLTFIPKHFFIPNVIEKRKPLGKTARRTGWTGCNILINKIANQGRIKIISNGLIYPIDEVLNNVKRCNMLEIKDIQARCWLFDILSCINNLPSKFFSLHDIYLFEDELHSKYPQNKYIRPKIRQQLQFLRGKGIIKFLGNGQYEKIA